MLDAFSRRIVPSPLVVIDSSSDGLRSRKRRERPPPTRHPEFAEPGFEVARIVHDGAVLAEHQRDRVPVPLVAKVGSLRWSRFVGQFPVVSKVYSMVDQAAAAVAGAAENC